ADTKCLSVRHSAQTKEKNSMKHYIIVTIVLLACSCRSIQQRSSNMLHSDRTTYQDRITAGQLFRQQDSSNRYWSFRTDTTFYFHPDSGLYAKGGKLWLQEIQQYGSFGQQIYDSLTYRGRENQQLTQKRSEEHTSELQ